MLPLGPNEEVLPLVTTSTEWEPALGKAVDTATHATAATALTQDASAKLTKKPQDTMISPQKNISPIDLVSASSHTHSLPTPIVISKLEETLAEYPDTQFVSQLCNNLRHGARIGFQGHRTPRFSKNLPTALAQPDIVTSNLAREISLGRIAGPFDSPPFPAFQVSPIGLVPKKNSNKFRTIFHLSFPKTGITSINYSISQENFGLQYVTIDNAIEGIKRFGQGCFLAKTDIESAFRLIPVHPNDYELLGMHWKGKYYYDKVLPFGLRSAPYIFNQLSDAIEWILVNKCCISFVCHILDDFLIIEPSSPHRLMIHSVNRV